MPDTWNKWLKPSSKMHALGPVNTEAETGCMLNFERNETYEKNF